jgi:hypothetical protein
MKKTNNTNAIVFAQASDNTKAVVADRYVIHALYTQNKALVESLDGTLVKGVGGFRAEFKTVKNAKAFIAQAITHIDADEYAKTRKTAPKTDTLPELVPLIVVHKKTTTPKRAKGDIKPDLAPTTAPKPKNNTNAQRKPKQSKGNAELTDAQKKRLDICKMSILNRAASAYSIANGGSATNFKSLGKTEADLAAYIPNAKAGLLKSDKWAKAVAMGITEDMLGC